MKAGAKEYDVALQYTERSIAVTKALAERYPETPLVRQQIANLYGQLARCELFCKRPQRAIAAARTALELDASQVWFKAMLAHGLLLAGPFEEAKNLYLENRSVRLGNGQSFSLVVLLHFGELRANGISHPDMGRIEKTPANREWCRRRQIGVPKRNGGRPLVEDVRNPLLRAA